METLDFSAIESFLEIENVSSEITMFQPQHSAFTAYVQLHSNTNTVAESSQTLHKRCFRFLKKIDEDRKLQIQSSCRRADPEKKTAFHHMIRERNRRVKFNEHFHNLYSLLPTSCKKDRVSILKNATCYMRELKLRVCELEQENKSAHDSTRRNFSNSGEGSGGFESQQKSFNFISESSLLYRNDDVVLEQCKDFSCQVKIIIDVQRNMVSCPSTLLLKVIALLSAEQLEILSLSHEKGFGFQVIFIVLPKVSLLSMTNSLDD
ncbi:hypothetical protein SUGI_0444680 [Cryptomeria japonica]|nr:hypothetical protein SUGI_0444680 [Cryptomeria japonica]